MVYCSCHHPSCLRGMKFCLSCNSLPGNGRFQNGNKFVKNFSFVMVCWDLRKGEMQVDLQHHLHPAAWTKRLDCLEAVWNNVKKCPVLPFVSRIWTSGPTFGLRIRWQKEWFNQLSLLVFVLFLTKKTKCRHEGWTNRTDLRCCVECCQICKICWVE